MTEKNKKATVKKASEKKTNTLSKKKTTSKTATKSPDVAKEKEEIVSNQEASPAQEETKKQSETKKRASSTKAKKKETDTQKGTTKKTTTPTTKSKPAVAKSKKSTASKEKTKASASKTHEKNEKSSYIDISSGIKDKDSDTFKLTKRGLEILKSELKELKTVKRAEISERIRQARALGDISENSEYEDAKREQAVVEIRISELENMLRKSVIVDEDFSDDNGETVRMGHSVVIESIEFKERQTYTIVSVLEADPFINAISNVSPLGSALIGHQVGNVIRVVLPTGAVRYRLVEIRKKES
jgi:transcription elongation factor GreA